MSPTRAMHRRGPVRLEHSDAKSVVRVVAAWEVSTASLPKGLAFPDTEDAVLEITADLEPGRVGPVPSSCSWCGWARLTHPRTGAVVELDGPRGGEGLISAADQFVHVDLPGLLRASVGPGLLFWAATPLLAQLGIRGGCSQLVGASVVEV